MLPVHKSNHMIFTIALYLFATSLAFAMIARKIWQFRTRRILEGSYEEADWTDLSIESIRVRLGELLTFSIHHFVLLALKLWIIISNSIKRIDRWIKKRLTLVLHKNGHLPAGGRPSKFIRNIRARKDEVSTAIHGESTETKEE